MFHLLLIVTLFVLAFANWGVALTFFQSLNSISIRFSTYGGRLCGILPLLFFFILSTSLNSQVTRHDPFQDPFILEIHNRHQKAVDGDKAETKALLDDLEKLTQQRPYDSLLLAYLGSTYTLLSRDTFPGPKKLEHLKKGGKYLDDAVDRDPKNSATRFIRAVNYYQLPTLFNKRGTAREDFQILVKEIEDPGHTQQLSPETQQAIYYYAGLSYLHLKHSEEAISAWKNGIKINETSDLAQKMKKELSRVKPCKKS